MWIGKKEAWPKMRWILSSFFLIQLWCIICASAYVNDWWIMFGVITDIWAQTDSNNTVSCYPPDIKDFFFTICDFEKH